MSGLHVVTGALGYSGQYIARRLLEAGHEVRTLTNSPQRPNPFGDAVRAYPYNFDRPDELRRSLEGAAVLYNTYWVRFNTRQFNQAQAVRNTRALFDAAKAAGVKRIVHVSITNPDAQSDMEYFRHKAEMEDMLRSLGVSYAILRPAILFGGQDILINNIAWTLRHMPVFGMFGNGRYRLQPIHVDDLSRLAVEAGGRSENEVMQAIGPQTFRFRDLVRQIAGIVGVRRLIVPLPASVAFAGTKAVGWAMGDVVSTWQEVRGLMAEKLYVEAPPAGTTRLTDWASEHADTLGRHYASELGRRRDRQSAY